MHCPKNQIVSSRAGLRGNDLGDMTTFDQVTSFSLARTSRRLCEFFQNFKRTSRD